MDDVGSFVKGHFNVQVWMEERGWTPAFQINETTGRTTALAPLVVDSMYTRPGDASINNQADYLATEATLLPTLPNLTDHNGVLVRMRRRGNHEEMGPTPVS